MRNGLLSRTLLALIVAFPATALAELRSEMSAYVVKAGQDGTERLEHADAARPGDVIEYRLMHTNTFADALRGVAVVGPIPEGLELVNAFRSADIPAVFELQGDFDPDRPGEEWSPLPVTRIVVDPDGTRRSEPARREHFTAVRWRLEESLPGGRSVRHVYRVRVK